MSPTADTKAAAEWHRARARAHRTEAELRGAHELLRVAEHHEAAAQAMEEVEALRVLLAEAAERLLDDAALLHRTGMLSDSPKYARAAGNARRTAARINAALAPAPKETT